MNRPCNRYFLLLVFVCFLALYVSNAMHGIIHNNAFDDERIYWLPFRPWGKVETNGFLLYHLLIALGLEQVQLIKMSFYMRLISFVSSLFSLWGAYLLGNELGGKRAGILSAFLLSMHALFIGATCSGRFYGMNQACTIWSLLLLVIACKREKWLWWILYGMSAFCMVSTLVHSAAQILMHAIVFLGCWWPTRKRSSLIWFSVVTIAVISWILLLIARDSSEAYDFDYGTFDKHSFYHVNAVLFGNGANYCEGHCGKAIFSDSFGENEFSELVNKQRRRATYVYEAVTMSLLLLAIIALLKPGKSPKDNERIVAFIALGIIVSYLASMAVAILFRNVFMGRHASSFVPVMSVLFGLAAFRWRAGRFLLLVSLWGVTTYTVVCTGLCVDFNPQIVSWLKQYQRAGDVFVLDDALKMPYVPRLCVRLLGVNDYARDIESLIRTVPHAISFEKDRCVDDNFIDINSEALMYAPEEVKRDAGVLNERRITYTREMIVFEALDDLPFMVRSLGAKRLFVVTDTELHRTIKDHPRLVAQSSLCADCGYCSICLVELDKLYAKRLRGRK